MEGATTILVVDDDPNVFETLKPWLAREGFEAIHATSGSEGLETAEKIRPDVIILDVMLPGLDGVSVSIELNRRLPLTPILMLSARDDVMDRVIGIESGADDYVTKPFHPREVVTRVKALLRRLRKISQAQNDLPPSIELGTLRVEPSAYRAYVSGEEVSLTTTEFGLLLTLMESPNQVHSRQVLLDKVWGTDFYGSERTVDSHIRNLRKKLAETSPGFDPIESVRGVGYRFQN